MVGSSAATAAGTSARSAAMVNKAFFQVVGGLGSSLPNGPVTVPRTLRCGYNPSTLSIKGGASWSEGEEQAARRDLPRPQFAKPNPRTLRVELFLDDWESMSGDISRDVQTLFDWMRPRDHNGEVRPPFLQFQWGTRRYFKAYLSNVDVTYELFRQDGTPVRATATVTLNEVPDDTGLLAQNPTSGGRSGRRTRVLAAGDTLHSLAVDEYGDASLWRGLAEANGVDDPLRLRNGTRVLVPPIDEVAALSRPPSGDGTGSRNGAAAARSGHREVRS